MKKGIFKIIATATGYSPSMVYQVHQGKKKNAVIEELITLSKTDREGFAKRLQEERSITRQVYA